VTAALNLRPPIDWSGFHEALARAQDAGYAPAFWWRDDDAVRHTPALDRLLAMSRRFGVPVALAAIPARIEPSLATRLGDESLVTVLVHGHSHANHAPPGEKKAEFGAHRPRDAMMEEAREGLAVAMAARLPVAPVFVPPWNRVAADLIAALPPAGYRGLSTVSNRAAALAAPGLVQVNVHLDPIEWRGHRGLRDPAMLVAALAAAVTDRTERRADRGEAVGLLTHHLVHDEAVWGFCEEFLEQASRRGGMRFPPTRVLFEADREGRSECSVTHDG
jgi:predicted deacetylase